LELGRWPQRHNRTPANFALKVVDPARPRRKKVSVEIRCDANQVLEYIESDDPAKSKPKRLSFGVYEIASSTPGFALPRNQ